VTSNEAVLKMVAALDAAGVPYLLAGSYSSNVYGVVRATKDADFVVQLSADSFRALRAELGADLELDPQVSFETVTGTTRYVVRVVGSPFKVELFCVSNDPHDRERFVRRRLVPLLGRGVYLPSPEDVVVTKLRWLQAAKRSKDREDIRNLIAVQGDRLDWDYICRWCDQHSTRALLDEIRRSLPPL